MSSLITSVIVIILFRYLGTILSFLKRLVVGKPQTEPLLKPKEKTKRTRLDKLCAFILVPIILSPLLYLYDRPYNLIYDIGARPEEPSFLFREKYQKHMDSVIRTTGMSADLHQELDALYESLRMNENRLLYWTWGHNAYTKCLWCKNDMQYASYTFPTYFVLAVLFIFGFGITTISPRYNHLRVLSVIVVVIVNAVFVAMGLNPDVTRELLADWPYPIHDSLVIGSNVFMSVFALILLFASREPNSELLKLKQVAESLDVSVGLANLYSMLGKSVMLNPDLRNAVFGGYEMISNNLLSRLELPSVKVEIEKIKQTKENLQFKDRLARELVQLLEKANEISA